ncbi:MAG: hypothetical protein ACIALR_12895 [Blastopirellula sp. JB062]
MALMSGTLMEGALMELVGVEQSTGWSKLLAHVASNHTAQTSGAAFSPRHHAQAAAAELRRSTRRDHAAATLAPSATTRTPTTIGARQAPHLVAAIAIDRPGRATGGTWSPASKPAELLDRRDLAAGLIVLRNQAASRSTWSTPTHHGASTHLLRTIAAHLAEISPIIAVAGPIPIGAIAAHLVDRLDLVVAVAWSPKPIAGLVAPAAARPYAGGAWWHAWRIVADRRQATWRIDAAPERLELHGFGTFGPLALLWTRPITWQTVAAELLDRRRLVAGLVARRNQAASRSTWLPPRRHGGSTADLRTIAAHLAKISPIAAVAQPITWQTAAAELLDRRRLVAGLVARRNQAASRSTWSTPTHHGASTHLLLAIAAHLVKISPIAAVADLITWPTAAARFHFQEVIAAGLVARRNQVASRSTWSPPTHHGGSTAELRTIAAHLAKISPTIAAAFPIRIGTIAAHLVDRLDLVAGGSLAPNPIAGLTGDRAADVANGGELVSLTHHARAQVARLAAAIGGAAELRKLQAIIGLAPVDGFGPVLIQAAEVRYVLKDDLAAYDLAGERGLFVIPADLATYDLAELLARFDLAADLAAFDLAADLVRFDLPDSN